MPTLPTPVTNEDILALVSLNVARMTNIEESVLNIGRRLDLIDLNGAAQSLREFGYFLRDNPDFLTRAKTSETDAQEWLSVKSYLARHFKWIKRPKLALGAVFTGLIAGLTFVISPGIVHEIGRLLHYIFMR